eukprot:g1120.t1
MILCAIVLVLGSCWSEAAAAESMLNFSHIYSNEMVLQRELAASVTGWATPNATVKLTLDTNASAGAVTTASAAGRWRALLPPQPASALGSAGATLRASSSAAADKDALLTGVVFGDVWVCSGQSNMAFSVSVPLNDAAAEAKIAHAYAADPGASRTGRYVNTSEAIATSARYADVRFAVVGNKHDCAAPIDDFYPSPGNNKASLPLAHAWQKSSPGAIGGGKDVMGGNGDGEMSAVCWFFGAELHDTLRVPIGLIHSSYGGSAVEDWLSKDTLGDGKSGPCPGPIVGSMGQPSQQYNGQLHPLLNTTIKGAVWYQGESNNGQNELYACRYEQLMREWRAEWHVGTGGATDPQFPMGFVQIGPMTNDEAHPDNTFQIRMGQTAGYGYAPNARWPNAFMGTAFDLANPPGSHCIAGCIHIFNKQAAAHRLALGARRVAYGEAGLVFSGPRVEGVAVAPVARGVEEAGAGAAVAATVTYGAVGTEGAGIVLRGAYGFEGSADGGKTWVRGNATAATKTTVTVAFPAAALAGAGAGAGAGAALTHVRYAFDDAPSIFTGTGPAVFNGEGLPATPGMYNVTQ